MKRYSILLSFLILACNKAAVVPDQLPPKVITVKEKCMEPPPALPPGNVPTMGNDDEIIILTRGYYTFLLTVISSLTHYIQVQYERCGQETP